MASAAATTVVRRVLALAKTSPPKLGNRQLHSSGTKQVADHGSSGRYSNDYIHAPTMYDLPSMRNRRAKMGLFVFGGLTVAVCLPLYAVHFQQVKAKAG